MGVRDEGVQQSITTVEKKISRLSRRRLRLMYHHRYSGETLFRHPCSTRKQTGQSLIGRYLLSQEWVVSQCCNDPRHAKVSARPDNVKPAGHGAVDPVYYREVSCETSPPPHPVRCLFLHLLLPPPPRRVVVART